MSISKSALVAMSRLFSAAVFKQLAKSGESPIFARLVQEIGTPNLAGSRTVAESLDAAFRTINVPGRRDEYVYKSAIARKILLGRHSLRTATMLTEVRVEGSKADVVVLNGTSTVYEIKSDRDSLARLPAQLNAYRRSFASVNVITSAGHAAQVVELAPPDVGVLVLNERGKISEVQKSVCVPERIRSENLLGILRASEAIEVLSRLGHKVPSVPNTQRYRVICEMFAELDPISLHETVTRVLRQSRNQEGFRDFLTELPLSLHAAALCIPISERDRPRIISAINTPIDEAIAWI